MKAITRDQIIANDIPFQTETEKVYIEKIIDEFNFAISIKNFHYLSHDGKKYVFYPAEQNYCKPACFEKAVIVIAEAGWDVEYRVASCGHGWFNAIIIKNFPE